MEPTASVPTLDDVAARAGVSTATVSRCLNMPDKVSAATRDRVMEAVNALGYTPNFGARVMAAKRTFTIGAIIPTMENAIFARGLQAFQETLHERGYTLLVASSSYSAKIEAEQVRALVARGADGLLLIGQDRAPDIYNYLSRRDIPTLLAWTYAPGSEYPSIGFDNRAAMATLAEHVFAQGHRDIAVISGHMAGNDRATQRVRGIQNVAARHGLDPTAIPVIQTAYGIDTGAAAFAELMQADTRPTAVMCGNDVLAVGALQQAQKMGLRVPDDVSLTGFDNMELSRIVTPQLTTVQVPHWDMGTQAAQELIRMVEKESPGVSTQLPVSVIQRASLRARR